jgi:hypothetical protein
MTVKELIQRAIVNASDEKPVDFRKNMELAAADKLKSGLSAKIKATEQSLFRKR